MGTIRAPNLWGARKIRAFALGALLWVTAGCNIFPQEQPQSPSNSKPEPDYCQPTSPVPTGANYLTVTGVAKFRRPVFTTQGLGRTTTTGGANDPVLKPIRYAEVVVTNSSGSSVFCTATANDGSFTVVVPKNSGSLLVNVNSRIQTTNIANVSVLDAPSSNTYYTVATSITAGETASPTSLSITAEATNSSSTDKLMAAPFNILDVILRANEFLRAKTANCSSAYSGCTAFTTASKISAYWKKGFNPGLYVGSDSGTSFYLSGTSQLYILGGDAGDTNSSDTDHFDDAVIAHEYGHFIEDVLAKSDSPGGSHNANSVIDPRLAWGEGWANFFGIAAAGYGASGGDPVYRDTIGNADGSASYIFNYDLESNQNLSAGGTKDTPAVSGEGNFREFAITRFLWDLADGTGGSASLPDSDTDSVDANGEFGQMWGVFTVGLKDSARKFRNFGLFSLLASPAPNGRSSLLAESDKLQRADQKDFSAKLITCSDQGNPDVFSMTPNTCVRNQYYSNDFYRYAHAGGAAAIEVVQASGGAVDLDVYLYREGYTYGETSDMAGSALTVFSGSLPATVETLSAAPAGGTYMININAAAGTNMSGSCYVPKGSGVTTTYKLKINGSFVCVDLTD